MAVPLKSTVEAATKLVPVSVMVVLPLPASALFGLTLERVGAGLLMVKLCEPDVPPPGPALTTVIGSVPAVVRSAVGMMAVSNVGLLYVVEIAVPLKFTVDPAMKWV